jgi:hypothetical protein
MSRWISPLHNGHSVIEHWYQTTIYIHINVQGIDDCDIGRDGGTGRVPLLRSMFYILWSDSENSAYGQISFYTDNNKKGLRITIMKQKNRNLISGR